MATSHKQQQRFSEETDDDSSSDSEPTPKKQRRMKVKKIMTKSSFNKDGGKIKENTISVQHDRYNSNDNGRAVVIPALLGADLDMSVSLPKMTKEEMPEVCLLKIMSVDEIELSNRGSGGVRRKTDAGETAMSMTLKPIFAEGRNGAIIRHDDEPTKFIAYNGEPIPDKFTMWASKAHKNLIKTRRWGNPEESYMYIHPMANRYHPTNMYRSNVALNYRIYTPQDILNLMAEADIDEIFSIFNHEHLDVIMKDMVAASIKTLASNSVACIRNNKAANRAIDSGMKPMEKHGDKLTKKVFFLNSLAAKQPLMTAPKRKRGGICAAMLEGDSSEEAVDEAPVKKQKKKMPRKLNMSKRPERDTFVMHRNRPKFVDINGVISDNGTDDNYSGSEEEIEEGSIELETPLQPPKKLKKSPKKIIENIIAYQKPKLQKKITLNIARVAIMLL